MLNSIDDSMRSMRNTELLGVPGFPWFPLLNSSMRKPKNLTCISSSAPIGKQNMNVVTFFSKAGPAFLLWFFCGMSPCAYAEEAIPAQTIVLPAVEGIDWVRLCVKQYPEILWLADKDVRKTEEGKASLQDPYSKQLFGEKFIEFDRTIMTLRCLKLILDGDEQAYQEFTKAQPGNLRLSKESFDDLHAQGASLLQSLPKMSKSEVRQAMEAALVLGDIGKSEKARKIFEPYGAKAPDHDDFHEEVMHILQKHPELCPTFNALSPAGKKLLSQTANLAHYGHITHIEGGPSMFSKLKQRNPSKEALSFDFFVHTCDVAGALGHANKESSLVYTQSSHRAMQEVLASCKVLADPCKTEVDAYNAYLAIRADWLGLHANDRIERALTRVGAMLRLFTKEEGTALKEAVAKLSPDVRNKVIEQLDIRTKGDELARTPTYIPAVLVNLASNFDSSSPKEKQIAQAVTLGLPFIARVLETRKKYDALSDIPLNFNKAAGVAKTNPSALEEEYTIDAQGNVCIALP